MTLAPIRRRVSVPSSASIDEAIEQENFDVCEHWVYIRPRTDILQSQKALRSWGKSCKRKTIVAIPKNSPSTAIIDLTVDTSLGEVNSVVPAPCKPRGFKMKLLQVRTLHIFETISF